MLLSLEALRARHGDSLILHFGDKARPRLIVIDGGPAGVYRDAFRPRLDELGNKWAPGAQLEVDVLMISHIDSDHIRGVLDLSEELVDEADRVQAAFRVRTLWHNAFDETLDDAAPIRTELPKVAAASLAGAATPSWEGDSEAVIASVAEGDRLRRNARRLGWPLNDGFEKIVMAPAQGGATIELGELSLTVVCPLAPQLKKLREEWSAEIERLRKAKDAKEAARIAENLDRSVYNLSSIVCLAELEDKRVLLTGDARGDHILEGLDRAGLLDSNGEIAVEVLKLPHHGSDRNVDLTFFQRIRAQHYLVSADGGYGNPEVATFELLSEARSDDDFDVHLTYRQFKGDVGQKLDQHFRQEAAAGRRYGVHFRTPDALSLRIDLLEAPQH